MENSTIVNVGLRLQWVEVTACTCIMTRLQPCNAARKLATRCTLPIGTLFRRVRYTDTNLVGYRFSNHYHHHHRRASCHRCNHPSCHRFLSSSQQCWAGTSFNARHTRFSRFLSNFAISPPTIFGREWNCCSSTQSSSENRRTSSLIDFAIVLFFSFVIYLNIVIIFALSALF